MFKTVAFSYVKVTSYFLFLILGFAASFKWMVPTNSKEYEPFGKDLAFNVDQTGYDWLWNTENPFHSAWSTVLICYVLIFVFVLVFTNLLTALAIDDIQKIRQKAELEAWVSYMGLITINDSIREAISCSCYPSKRKFESEFILTEGIWGPIDKFFIWWDQNFGDGERNPWTSSGVIELAQSTWISSR